MYGIYSNEIYQFGVHHVLGELLKEGKMSDVTFKVEGETFAAHRLILAARSPVLKAELFGSMAESRVKMSPISVKDMQADVFRSMFQYIYTNEVPKFNYWSADQFVMAQHLLVAADRYALEGLKLICEWKLKCYISLDKVTSIIALAELHNCTRLKDACLTFIVAPDNVAHLMMNSEYIKLIHDFPSLLAEIQAKFLSKK